MPVYDYKYLLQSNTANTTHLETTNAVDFGVASPGVNKGGKFGMHIIVTTAFTGAASGTIFGILHSAADDLAIASVATQQHTMMCIPTTQLTKGAHFFLPMSSLPLLRYACGFIDPISEALATGYTTIYFGDAEPV